MQTPISIYLILLIAAAAFIFVAELCCVILLDRKIQAAKRRERDSAKAGSWLSGLFLTTLPGMIRTPELVLFILLAADVAFALVLAGMLVYCRAKGYLFVSGRSLPEDDSEEKKDPTDEELGRLWGEPAAEPETVAEPPRKEEPAEEPAIPTFAEQEQPATGEETPEEEKDAARQRVTRTLETTVTETVREIYPDSRVKEIEYVDHELRVRDVDPTAEETDDEAEDTAQDAELYEENYEEEPAEPAEYAAEDNDEAVLDSEEEEEPGRFSGNERVVGFDPERGCDVIEVYRKSFEARLIQAPARVKRAYSAIKNALLAYEGTGSRVSWSMDSFSNNREPIARINIVSGCLVLYFALDPASLEGTVYNGKDVGGTKRFERTPFRFTVRSSASRKFGWALELVRMVCEEHGLSPIDIEPVDYEETYPFDTLENLIARGLVRVTTRYEQRVSTFEPDDTAPAQVSPDGEGLTFEMDNDAAREEPQEEEPAEEPAIPASSPVHTRETVRVTKTVYTETLDGADANWNETELSPRFPGAAPGASTEQTEENGTEPPASAESSEEEPSGGRLTQMFELDEEENERTGETERRNWYAPQPEPSYEAEQPEESYEEPQPEPTFYGEEPPEQPLYVSYEESEQSSYEQPQEEAPYEAEPPRREVRRKKPSDPYLARVDVSILDANFHSGETVNLDVLKDRGLVEESARRLRIVAMGTHLYEKLTVEADQFTTEALLAIAAAGGETIMLRRGEE